MKRLLTIIGAAMVLFTGCETESFFPPETPGLVVELMDNSEIVNSGVTILNTPIEMATFSGINNKSTKMSSAQADFTFVAEVASPDFHGEKLSATSVAISQKGNSRLAYVTYNMQGTPAGGALQVIDITDKTKPVVTSLIYFNEIDINICEYSRTNDMLWLGGSSFKKGAVVIPVALDSKGYVKEPETGKEMELTQIEVGDAASVNGIVQGGDWLFVSAGNKYGGTWALNIKANYRVDGMDPYNNAKFSAADGNANGSHHVTLEGGQNAKLHVYNIGVVDDDIVPEILIGSIYHNVVNPADMYTGKATLFMEKNSDIAYVAMGANGVRAVNIRTGAIVATTDHDLLEQGNTNSVCVDNDFVYMANGADGLVIAKKPSEKGEYEVLEPIFKWDNNESYASANFVTTDKEYIFLAKGAKGGLKILVRN